MSTPFAPPPLPPGWTEHTSPTGQPYYFNATTQESTYVRPLPTFLLVPGQGHPAFPLPQAQALPRKKKEKPLTKTPIPGTEWLRVRTTEGNVFYTHKARKESVWTVPEEIKDALEALEREEAEEKLKAEKEKEDEEREKEGKRAVKKAEKAAGKRKAQEIEPVEEVVISKRARTEDEDEEDGDDAESDEESEEEEEWQREAAAQLAAEAEAERKRKEEEQQREQEEQARLKAEAEAQKNKPLNMPNRVDLSIEEAKALFKTLLREKDVNPLHPWDTSLPLFVSDPRYVLLPNVSARKEAFDEYCRERARELRQNKVKQEKTVSNPKEEFDALLKAEVKSTRTSWTEWRRQWKKDRRFYGWGKDDREREKKFRDYLKELGEKKRAAAQKAEADFFVLLKESGIAKSGAIWKDVKKKIVDDSRYDAVGSSSLREELFNTYLKARGEVSAAEPGEVGPGDDKKEDIVEDESQKERKRKERQERALRERAEQVRAEKSKNDAQIERARAGLHHGEAQSEFRTLLVDAIRDPQVTWDSALPQLETDPRFTGSNLSVNLQVHMFHSHVNQLRTKHLDNLHGLFASHAPTLDKPFTELPVSSLVSSLPATKLGFDVRQLEDEYAKWQRERSQQARLAFDEMLGENAFVEFWGRFGKLDGKGLDESIKGDDIGEDDEGTVDMKALAKTVDLKEMVKVLRNDRRYLMFDHIPEQRERWLRDYLASLSAPKLSVHVSEAM